MADNENKPGSKIVLIGLIFPIILVFAIDYSVNGTIQNFGIDQINPRIANSALTAYILASTVLLGNMFFYGESRKRPMAPIFAMIISVSVGVLATIFFINQGPMLLEGNGSVRAQMVYNVAHTIVSLSALILSLFIALGLLFSSITHAPTKISKSYLMVEEE